MTQPVRVTTGAWRARLSTAPALLWFALFMGAPMVMLFVVAVGQRSPSGGYTPGFTFENSVMC